MPQVPCHRENPDVWLLLPGSHPLDHLHHRDETYSQQLTPTRNEETMRELIFINALIILLDLGLLGLEAASLYILETLVKGVVYSIKLKLEFAILSKLVNISGGSSATPTDFVNVDRDSVDDPKDERKTATVLHIE
jgi:hypothetical protein